MLPFVLTIQQNERMVVSGVLELGMVDHFPTW